MSFRGKALLYFILALGMSSCSWWGDESQQSTGISLDTTDVLRFGDVNCIKGTGAFFADFFKGRSSTAEIKSMQDCIENTLDSMFDLAYKDDALGFNRARIKNVLASVVDNNNEYDLDDLADLIFRLKRFFVGGGKDSFFKEEWERFKPDLADVANALISSQDSAKTIFFSSKDENLIEREEFYSRLNLSFQAIDRVKNRHPKTLEIEEIESLVSVLLKVSDLDRFTPIAMTARQMIYPTEKIFELEQGAFLKTVWDVFEIQTRVREIDFSEGILVGESSADVVKSLEILTDRLMTWSNRYPETYNFNTDQVKSIVNQMFEIGFLSDTVTDATPINDTIENMFIRIFGSTVLNYEDFNLLSEVFKGWANYYPKLLEDLSVEWAQNVYSVLADEEKLNDENNVLMDEILSNFEQPKFISGPNMPIHILYNERRELTPEENYLDKSLKQLFLALAMPVIRAYNPELNEAVRSADVLFNTAGLDRLLYDFRPIGLELGFVNRYSCNSSGRIFIEANLLTRNANGDQFVSLIEAAEWLGTMIVTSSLTDHIFSKVNRECAYSGEEMYGYPFYDRSCFQRSMFNNRSNLEHYFPDFSRYMSLLRSGDRATFEEKIGGWFNYGNSYYDYNELDPDFFEVVFMNQMNTCFQVKDTEEYLDFPLSRSEFNATIATLVYVENFFEQYDTSGLSTLFGDDPSGQDLVIDGQELSAFAREKVNEENTRMIARAIRDESWWARRYGSEERWVRTLRDLPEWAVKMDRQRVTDLIKNIMSDTVVVDDTEEAYCEQVMGSLDILNEVEPSEWETQRRTVVEITYDTEAALQCPYVPDEHRVEEAEETSSSTQINYPSSILRRENRDHR